MDFVAKLPPEIVVRILSYLDVRDLLHCRAVSREWREYMGGYEQCWKNACQQAGLSQYKINEYSSRFSLPTIAAAVLKHRHWVKSSHSMVDSLVGSTDFNLRRVLHLLITSGPSNATCFLGHEFVTVGLQPPVDVRSVCTASKANETSHKSLPQSWAGFACEEERQEEAFIFNYLKRVDNLGKSKPWLYSFLHAERKMDRVFPTDWWSVAWVGGW